MNVTTQRRMAALIMKCGVNRVKINPNNLEDISEAVTRDDIRKLIKEGIIDKRPKAGISGGRKKYVQGQKDGGKRKGHGSRKGSKYARFPKKRRWISTIRPIRRVLREYRGEGVISDETYRYYYRHASGGVFRSVGHMKMHMEAEKAYLKRPSEVK
ncbi:MAG: 50S ribosomal protein L19e [Candidatus Thermoplasmatota archaeon]|nr:50S ribosomal protein L19e [Candidatus Thermoplasmatota archaeon]